jgi:nucleoside-diphosphate-sugar epimerase
MRIFVTGGSGFVGGYLIPKLIEAGHDVVALARSSHSLKEVEARRTRCIW